VSKQYEAELIYNIKSKYEQCVKLNNEQGKKSCESMLSKEFSSIEKKLRTNEYKSFGEFESDAALFYNYFMEKIIDIPNKEKNLLEFLNGSIKRAAAIFIKEVEKELDINKSLSK